MQQPSDIRVSFRTNGFILQPYATIALSFACGMTLMMLGIFAGAPVMVSMILLTGGIGAVFAIGMGSILYTLTPEGIQQDITRWFAPGRMQKQIKRFISWGQIASFKNDSDYGRSSGQYEYLKLYLRTAPGEIWITDQRDKKGFEQFKNTFLRLIRESKATQQDPMATPVPSAMVQQTAAPLPGIPVSPEAQQHLQRIVRKKSFYRTAFAKILTLFFTGLTLFLIWMQSYHGLHFTNWFKLLFVILPGTVYMLYRVYFSEKEEEHQNRYLK